MRLTNLKIASVFIAAFCFSSISVGDNVLVCVRNLPGSYVVKTPLKLTYEGNTLSTNNVSCTNRTTDTCAPASSDLLACDFKFLNVPDKSTYSITVSPDTTSHIDQTGNKSFTLSFKRDDIIPIGGASMVTLYYPNSK